MNAMDMLKILLSLPYWSWIGMTIGILIVIFSFVLGYKATVSTRAPQDNIQDGAQVVPLSATRELISLVTFRKNELRKELDQIKKNINTKHKFIEHGFALKDKNSTLATDTIKALERRVFPLIDIVLDELKKGNLVTAHEVMAKIHMLSATIEREQKELERVADMLSMMAVGPDAIARNSAKLTKLVSMKISDFLTKTNLG